MKKTPSQWEKAIREQKKALDHYKKAEQHRRQARAHLMLYMKEREGEHAQFEKRAKKLHI